MSQAVDRRTKQSRKSRWTRERPSRRSAETRSATDDQEAPDQLESTLHPTTSPARPRTALSSAPATQPDAEALRLEVRQSVLLLALTFAVLALVAAVGWLLASVG